MSATNDMPIVSTECVGMGSFGNIFATSEQDIVCKIFKNENCISFPTEYAAMSLLHDVPNILKIHQIEYFKPRIYSQRYKINLNKYNIHKKISLEDIRMVIYKILIALHHTHSRGIMHRDIKGDNIFINYEEFADGTTKITDVVIGDWGSAYALGTTENTFGNEIQSLPYRAPEILACNNNYTSKIDVWSVGSVLLELLTRRRILSDSTLDDISALMDIFKICGTPEKFRQFFPNFEPNWSRVRILEKFRDEHVIDLLKHLLDLDPITRYTCLEASNHPFFDSVRQGKIEIESIKEDEKIIVAEVAKINDLADVYNLSDKTRRLAQYYYQLCYEDMKADEIILELYTISMAALLVDYRFMTYKMKYAPFIKMFNLIKHDLFGLKYFGITAEAFSELIPLRMLAEKGQINSHINKLHITNVTCKYTDNLYDYCVICIESYPAYYLRNILLTGGQLSQLNPKLAMTMGTWTHFATFENRSKYLLFRRKV